MLARELYDDLWRSDLVRLVRITGELHLGNLRND